jgi:hypothetical protein
MLKKSMPLHCLSLAALLSVLLLTVQPAPAGQVLDEQYGPDGAKVELVKAKIRNGVLTLAVRYIHPWVEEKQKPKKQRDSDVSYQDIDIKFKIGDVFYVAEGKRYHVLKDKEGNWLAAPVAGDYIGGPMDEDALQELMEKNKVPALLITKYHPIQVLWFKFPAPPEGVDEIEFQIPEVSPFDVEIKR